MIARRLGRGEGRGEGGSRSLRYRRNGIVVRKEKDRERSGTRVLLKPFFDTFRRYIFRVRGNGLLDCLDRFLSLFVVALKGFFRKGERKKEENSTIVICIYLFVFFFLISKKL